MAACICPKCGAKKNSLEQDCFYCSFKASTDNDKALALALSEPFSTPEQLAAYAKQIKRKLPLQLDMNVFASCYADVVAAREAEERESSDGSAAPPAFPTQAGSAAWAPAGAAAPNPAAFLNSPAAANRAYGPDPAAAASGASGAPPASSFPFLAAPAAFSPQPNAMGGLGGGGAAGPLAANGSIFGPAPAPAPEFPGLPPVYPWDPAWFDAPGADLSSGDELDALPEGFSLRADAPQSPRAGRLGPGARGASEARQSARPNGAAPFMPKGGDESNRGPAPSNASDAIGAQAIVAPPALLSPISPLQTADAASLFVGAAFSRAPGQKKRRDRRKSAGAGDSIQEAKGKARPSEKPNRRAKPLLDASGPTTDRPIPKPANPAPDGATAIDVEGGEPLPTLDVWGQSPQTGRVRAPSTKREAQAERKPSQEQGHRQGTKREQGQTGTARSVQNKTANRAPSLGADVDADADADSRAKNVFGTQGADSAAETKLGPDKSALQANRTPNRSASRFDDAGEEPSLDYSGIGVEAWAKADSIDSPFASRNPGKTEGPAASPAPDAESRVEASAATSATPLEPRPPKNEPKPDRLKAWAPKSAPDDGEAGLAEPAADRAIEHGASAEAAAAPTGSGESILAPQSIAAAFARKEREMQERELFRPKPEQPVSGAASAVGADADANSGIENKNKNETAALETDAPFRAHSMATLGLDGADASFAAAQDSEETGGKTLSASGDAVSEQFRIEDRGKAKSAASESETETQPVDAIEIGGWPPIPSAVDADVGLDVDIRVDSIAQNAQSGAFGRERFDLENDSAPAPDDRLEQTNAAPFPGFDLSHDDPAQRCRIESEPFARSADFGSFPGQAAEGAPGADDQASGILPPPGFADSLAFEIAPPSGLGETGEDPSASPDGANVRGERNDAAASEVRDKAWARAGFKDDGEGFKAVEAGGSEAPAFRSDGADDGLGAEAQSDAKNWERAPEKNDSPLRAAPKPEPKSDAPLDSLRSNPFYLLGASLRDGKEAIDRKSELLALRRAADDHSRLANEIANRPDARDAAELAWLPGASAEAERALRAKLEETPPLGSVGWDGSGAENLPLLALCNVLAAKIQIEGAASAQGARAACMALARLMEGVVAEDVAQMMAGHRAQAGAADPTSPERFGSFREALETHRQRIALDVGRAIGATVAGSDFLERLTREATQDGAILAPALIERMAAARDAALAGVMEKSLASAQAIAERYSVDDEGSRPGALPCARSLARLTEQWFQAAAPILLCQKPRCAFHRRTARFAQTIARFIDAAIVDANVLAKELFDLDDDALIDLADAVGPAVQDLAGALTICADLAEKLRRRVYLGKLDGQVEQIEQDAEAALEDLLDSAAPILEPPQT